MEPHQLRIAGKIGNSGQIRSGMPPRENPAEMTVEESGVARRMNVELGVGIEMVIAVVARPPQHALLRRALRQRGENELKGAAGLESAMREIAMVAGPDGENPQPVEADADRQRLHSDAGPDRPKARQMHKDEGHGGRID